MKCKPIRPSVLMMLLSCRMLQNIEEADKHALERPFSVSKLQLSISLESQPSSQLGLLAARASKQSLESPGKAVQMSGFRSVCRYARAHAWSVKISCAAQLPMPVSCVLCSVSITISMSQSQLTCVLGRDLDPVQRGQGLEPRLAAGS